MASTISMLYDIRKLGIPDSIRAWRVTQAALEKLAPQQLSKFREFVLTRYLAELAGFSYSREQFEQSLPGKKTGDTVTLPKRGQGKPGVIAEIKRIVPAEVTDDLAKKAGFNDLNAYREQKREEHENRDKRKKLDGIVSFIIKELREKCEFEDVEEADKDRLISRAFAEKDGVEFNREGYEAMVAKYVAEGMDEKQLRERMPYEDYLKFAPDNYITQCIQEYFADKFKAVIL